MRFQDTLCFTCGGCNWLEVNLQGKTECPHYIRFLTREEMKAQENITELKKLLKGEQTKL